MKIAVSPEMLDGKTVMNMNKSLKTAIIGIFAALHVTLYLLPSPLWRNWAVFLEPIEGIILGPYAGFLAATIGSSLGRVIRPDPLWMFGVVAEPLGVLVAGFLAKGKWKPVAAIYAIMLGAYFIHPFGQMLPLWTILDIPLALILIYPTAKVGKFVYEKNSLHLTLASALIFFVGTVTDSLTRVFLLVPVGLYKFFPDLSFEVLRDYVFVPGAALSFFEDGLAIIMSILIGVPLIVALRKIPAFEYPLT
jgi:uncharacterized membrane protein